MRRTVLFAGAIAVAFLPSFANATVRIAGDRGGRIVDYAARFIEVRQAGEPVVIDGACLSACTLVLGILPREQVCATPRAVLGFHAAWRPTLGGGKVSSEAATQAVMDAYPEPIRRWIGRHGGLTPHMIYLQGRELYGFVASCGRVTEASYRGSIGDQRRFAYPGSPFAAEARH